MSLSLQDLIGKEIFEEYSIVAAKSSLHREIKSVSILETPDFENYIIEDSVIITTFYPIKNELKLATSLLQTLKARNTAGIIIKMFRYIDDLPLSFVELAEKLSIPIITLNYDANLSTLFNNIISEIQLSEYSNLSLEQSYANVLQTVYENPTTETLMSAVDQIDNFELVIENLETNTISYSSKSVYDYYLKSKKTSALIQRVHQDVYYVENVIYEDKPIYKMMFLARKDRRHIIHNMIEVFRLLVIVVYQNKREKLRKQNAFLLNFVSNTYNDNVGHLEDYAKEFQWNIQFPLMILLLSNGAKDLINNSRIIEYCRSVILSKWGKSNDEIRFASIDDQILFLVNVESQRIDHQNILYLFESTDKAHPSSVIKIAYSNPIFELKDISKTYNLMNQSMAHMKRSESKKRIFNEDDLKIYDMLKTIQNEDIESFIQSLFSALNHITQIDKETLLYTYYVYIESRFNINTTAKKLFVHYNTVRYRLEQLKSYSIIPNINEDYFKTYFALYLYFSVYPSKTSFFLKQ